MYVWFKTIILKHYTGCLVTVVLNMLEEEKLGEEEKDTVLNHLKKLIQIDPTHQGYYNDISRLNI